MMSSRNNSNDSFRCSRATTPDELTPSLEESNQETPLPSTSKNPTMCVSCLAAPVATEIEIRQLEKEQSSSRQFKDSPTSDTSDSSIQDNNVIAITIENNYTSPNEDSSYDTSEE